MTIDELEDKDWDTWCILDDGTDHTKLTVQFTVEVLEKLVDDSLGVCLDCQYWENAFSKIQELKQYLDEKV